MAIVPDHLGKLLLERYQVLVPQGVLVEPWGDHHARLADLRPPFVVRLYRSREVYRGEPLRFSAGSYNEVLSMIANLNGHADRAEDETYLHIEEQDEGYALGCSLGLRLNALGKVVLEAISADGERTVRFCEYAKSLPTWRALELWEAAGINTAFLDALAVMTRKAYAAFTGSEMTLALLGELAIRDDGVIVRSTRMDIDDLALYHHPGLVAVADQEALPWFGEPSGLGGRGRGQVRTASWDRQGIAVVCTGTGLALMIYDCLQEAGVAVSSLSDVEIGVTEEQIADLFSQILNQEGLQGLLVLVGPFQFSRVDTYAAALVAALKAQQVDLRSLPVLIRVSGSAEASAAEILQAIPGVRLISGCLPLEEIHRTFSAPKESVRRL